MVYDERLKKISGQGVGMISHYFILGGLLPGYGGGLSGVWLVNRRRAYGKGWRETESTLRVLRRY